MAATASPLVSNPNALRRDIVAVPERRQTGLSMCFSFSTMARDAVAQADGWKAATNGAPALLRPTTVKRL
ncbi:hypothetical protein ACX4MT_02150 [Roseomonas mucosa]